MELKDAKLIKIAKKYEEVELRYKYEVEKDGEYEYIRSYRTGSILPNGKVASSVNIQVKHKYCGSVYETQAGGFISKGKRCGKCCQKYENSFAHHIEVELGEPLDKYWDFEKNVVNPYHIWKSTNNFKIWIKCAEKDYHGSYITNCNKFYQNRRCGYCNTYASGKVHALDSFGAKHPDKAKCWHEDNKLSPYEVSPGSGKKFKFRCDVCGNVFTRTLDSINNMGAFCSSCSSSKGEKLIASILNEKNIYYINDEQYFKDLIGCNGGILRPDFILPNEKIWIEYDGEFHYEGMVKNQTEHAYNSLKRNDKLKNEYATKNGWELIRIPYWEFDNIKNIIGELNI